MIITGISINGMKYWTKVFKNYEIYLFKLMGNNLVVTIRLKTKL